MPLKIGMGLGLTATATGGGAFSPQQLSPLAWYDVHSATPGQTVADQMGGTAATLGSTAGADANDPAWLAVTTSDYLYLSGVQNNYVTTPDTATLHVTGDLDVRFDAALSLWTPTVRSVLVGKWGSAAQRCFYLRLNTTGKLELGWTPDGTFTSLKAAISTVATGITDGSRWQLRATLDVDNGAGGYDAKSYIRDPALGLPLSDNTNWTQLGSTVTAAGVTSIFAGTDRLLVGGYDAALNETQAMSVYRATVHNGINGTLIADFDSSKFSAGSSTTYVDAVGTNAGTWTINRSTAGRKAETLKGRGLLLLGTDDFWTVPSASVTSFGTVTAGRVRVVGRAWPTPLSNGRWVDTRGSATETVAGVGIRQNGTAASLVGTIGDGTNTAATAAVSYTAGQVVVVALVVTATTIKLRINGTESATVARPAGSATGTTPIVGAATTAAASVFEGGTFAVLTVNRALSSTELASVESYYGAGT